MRRTTQPDGPTSRASNKKEEKGNRMTERNTLSRRLAASVGAFALATMGLLGTTVAHAGPPPGQDDAPGTGTLIIHKHAGTHTGDENLENGTLRPHVGAVFALEDAAAALQHVEQRRAVGKVLLRP